MLKFISEFVQIESELQEKQTQIKQELKEETDKWTIQDLNCQQRRIKGSITSVRDAIGLIHLLDKNQDIDTMYELAKEEGDKKVMEICEEKYEELKKAMKELIDKHKI